MRPDAEAPDVKPIAMLLKSLFRGIVSQSPVRWLPAPAAMAFLICMFSIAVYGTPYANPSRDMLPAVMADTLHDAGEREALLWMYDYMQYPDAYAMPPEFFLENVRYTLRAKREMPWGGEVPESEWKHFVLPLRVNNEALDMARPVIYEELAPRLMGMDMEEAALEVNHWAHEKAAYRPSDPRTSPPLSTISQGTGRCGEESTLVVAAMRAVGIPARQIYTPRWAHTDDNHAWVEVWISGKWHFLGACEPAPVLDMAWFNEPASRGLIMSTDVFGPYDGPEEVLHRTPLTTTINVTPNYAATGESVVTVVDGSGNPVEGVEVRFCIYNYADLYPVTVRKSDGEGKARIISGLGDIVAWASDGRRYGFATVNPSSPSTIELCRKPGDRYAFELNIVPPSSGGRAPVPSREEVESNDRRLAYEDSLRMASCRARRVDVSEAPAIARRLEIDSLAESLRNVLELAGSNGRMICDFLDSCGKERRGAALRLLMGMEEKDLRDVSLAVLEESLAYMPEIPAPVMERYVALPRIEWEALHPFRRDVLAMISDSLKTVFVAEPQKIADWASRNIVIDTDGNPTGLRMNPVDVLRARRADPVSRDMLCVGVLRALGIPARIDPITGRPQFLNPGSLADALPGRTGDIAVGNLRWIDLTYEAGDMAVAGSGCGSASENGGQRLLLTNTDTSGDIVPKYYSRFSVSAIQGGFPRQLEYPDGTEVGDEGLELEIPAGDYMLLSGTRLANGTVLAHGEVLRMPADEDNMSELPLVLREDDHEFSVIGSLDSENIYHDEEEGIDRTILSATGRGYYILVLARPGEEPTSHILNDISAYAQEFEASRRPILVLFESDDELKRFDRSAFAALPSTVRIGIDNGGKCLSEIVESLNLPSRDLPVTVIADTFNRIVFVSRGYSIGLPGTLLRPLR